MERRGDSRSTLDLHYPHSVLSGVLGVIGSSFNDDDDEDDDEDEDNGDPKWNESPPFSIFLLFFYSHQNL